jgi:hypothetical protein
MANESLSFDDLTQQGWRVIEDKGIRSPHFTSISFCWLQDHHTLTCVQGYGVDLDRALADATHEANKWLARQSSPWRL